MACVTSDASSHCSNNGGMMKGSPANMAPGTMDDDCFWSKVPMPLARIPKKRAVLCGVSYKCRRFELKSTVTDVRCMKSLLISKFGFTDDSILALTEEENDQSRIPTKKNIRAALKWLVQGSQHGDSLVFHYSGHCTQQIDRSGDESDGFDEALLPTDYETAGTMVDDEINATIVRPLPDGVTLHAIIDASHSGTILDLPFTCKMMSNKGKSYKWVHDSSPSTFKGTSGGLAIAFTSCADNQTATNTKGHSDNSTVVGAMTYSFIQALEREPGVSYGRLVNTMRSAIHEAQKGIQNSGPIASQIMRTLRISSNQEPQLSASEKFDINAKPFVL